MAIGVRLVVGVFHRAMKPVVHGWVCAINHLRHALDGRGHDG